MILKTLQMRSFRNYAELTVNFGPGLNFICGPNGSGKSNIIEAVAVISGLRSFRGASDQDMFMNGSESYYCSCTVKDIEYSCFEVGCSRSGGQIKRRMKIDGAETASAYDYFGKMLSVVFSPDDINLVNGPAEIRRRYFDSVISKYSRGYLEALREYRKILSFRNAVLKRAANGEAEAAGQMEVWDLMLAEKGIVIIRERESFITRFSASFREGYAGIIEPDNIPAISYKNSSGCAEQGQYIQKLKSRLKNDILYGYTGIGPHRDDFPIKDSGGAYFTSRASQGQKRAASLALKIGEVDTVEKSAGRKPLLLIDDVFSEFDEKRRHNLIRYFDNDRQSIFTLADKGIVENFSCSDEMILQVSQEGNVNEIQIR